MFPKNSNPQDPIKTTIENVVGAYSEPRESSVISKYQFQLNTVFNLMADTAVEKNPNYPRELQDFDDSLSTNYLDPDPKGLVAILNCGDFEFRTKLRNYLTFPNVQAKNQKLSLPYLQNALAGDVRSQEIYEATRFATEEVLPVWFRDEWSKEIKAPWRTLRGDSYEFKSFCKKNGLLLTKSEVPIFELKPLSSGQERFDARLGLPLYYTGSIFFEVVAQLNNRPFPDKKNIMADELDSALNNPFVNFIDSSIAGDFYRRSANTELNQIFTAILIDDALQVKEIKLSDSRKLEIWRGCFHKPWTIASHKLFTDGPNIKRILIGLGKAPSEVDQEVERLVFNKNELREFFRQLNGQPSKKGNEIIKQSETIQPIELHDESITSSQTKITTKEKISAALEFNLGQYSELDGDSRKLSKLVGNSEASLNFVLTEIANKLNPKDIIEKLRSQTESHQIAHTSSTKSVTEEAPLAQQQPPVENVRTERPKLILSKDVQNSLKDPQLKNIVMQTLERLMDRPESLERRRIWACDDIWEVKLVGQALRIYYFYPGNKSIAVLKIGEKKEQKKDVPKLNNIRKSLLLSIEDDL